MLTISLCCFLSSCHCSQYLFVVFFPPVSVNNISLLFSLGIKCQVKALLSCLFVFFNNFFKVFNFFFNVGIISQSWSLCFERLVLWTLSNYGTSVILIVFWCSVMVMKIVPSNKSILLVSHWHCILYVFQGFEVDFFVHDRGETPRFVGTSHLLPPAEDCSIHVKRAPIIGLNHRPIGEVKGFDTYSSSFLSGLLWLITVLHIKKYCDCPEELAVLTARLFMIRGGTPAI